MSYRVASGSDGSTILFSVNNIQIRSTVIKGAGGWNNWTTVVDTVLLEKGIQSVQLKYAGTTGDFFNINWIDIQRVSIANIIPASSTAICSDGSVVLTAGTGTGVTYKWLNNNSLIVGAASKTYTAITAGSYKVIAMLAGYADTSVAVTVTLTATPTAVITPASSLTFCSGGSVVLNAPTGNGLSYRWSNAAGVISGATASSYTALSAGTYTVKVSNGNCSAVSMAVTVTLTATPPAIITPASSLTFCIGGSVVLNANTGTGLSYQWSNSAGMVSGATASSYMALSAGTYTVKVSSGNCSATSSPLTVQVDALPTVSIAGSNQSITGSTVQFAGNIRTSGTGLWSVVKGNAIFTDATSANTFVQGIHSDTSVFAWTISNGACSPSVSMVTVYKGSVPVSQTIMGNVSVVPNAEGISYSVHSNSGSEFHWTVPAGAMITSSSKDSTIIVVSFGSTSGIVSVRETNAFGSKTNNLTVTIATTTAVIPAGAERIYALQPNPFETHTNLFIKTETTEKITLTITDMNGTVCYTSSDYVSNTEITVGETLVPGVYTIQISYLTAQSD